jgi:hypothetical protein
MTVISQALLMLGSPVVDSGDSIVSKKRSNAPPSVPHLEGEPTSTCPRPDPRALLKQQMASFKRDCDSLIKAEFEMEYEDRREMVQVVSELAAKSVAAVTLNQSMSSINEMQPHAQPSGGPVIAGEFNQKSKRQKQSDSIPGEEALNLP